MSGKILNWAARISTGDPTSKAVLLVLAEACSDNGETHLGQATIAERCDARRETVNRAMKRLEERGLIVRVARRRGDGYRSSDAIRLTLCDVNTRDVNAHEMDSHVTLSTISCDANRTAEPLVNPQIKDISSLAKPESKPRTRIKTPNDPEFESAYRAYPHFRGRSDKAASYREWQKLTPGDHVSLAGAIQAFADTAAGQDQTRQYVKAFERWISKGLWRDFVGAVDEEKPAPHAIDWSARVAKFKQSGAWVSSWGEKPSREGCQAPLALLQQYGYRTNKLRLIGGGAA